MRTSPTHLPSLLGSLLFILGAVFSLGVALVLGVVALGNLLINGQIQASETILLTVLGFEGLLLVGATYISIQKFLERPSADADSSFTISSRQIAACLVVAVTVILTGHLIVNSEPANWLLIPLLTLPAVILPIFILFSLAIRGITLGPRWRTWNVLGISMTLVPFITFILEVIVILLIFGLAIAFVMSQPELIAQMERLAEQIYLLESDPEALVELIAPLILRPGVITMAMVFFAILVPLIEELVKPLGVWLFANQISSPAQGFALGALSGSAYALIETLGVSPQSTEWAALLVTRIGTGILHVTASALMGAGIVYALRERRPLRLLGIYLLSVSMHGLWNGLAMIFTFSTITEISELPGPFNGLTTPVTAGMILLAVVYLAALILTNRSMRASLPKPRVEELVP